MAGKAKAADAAKVSSADAAGGATLLTKHAQAAKKTTPKAKASRKLTLEAITQKAIRDNFKGWPSLQTHGTVVDDETLFTTIYNDKLRNEANPGSVVMGSQYYRDLKQKFSGENSAYNSLKVTNPKEVVAPDLMAAMVSLKHQNANKVPLTDWMSQSDGCNQKEFIGILRSMCLLRPSASPAQLQLVLDCMRFITKNKLDSKYPDECKTMHPTWDSALHSSIKSFKQLDGDPAAWWENYKDTQLP